MERHRILTIIVLTIFGASAHGEEFLACLTDHGVRNFTTLSASPSTYNHFLDHSLHNLAFARPTFRRPSSTVLPESKEQLATTISCARNASLAIRMRSGGYSTGGLSSTADTPFVIIDLMNLNRVQVDLDSQTAWVESGATTGEACFAIGESSDTFAFVVGWSPRVGIGGYIGGGGTRKLGVAADNVLDAILIDANGRILDREKMGEDVFWAIRRGGGGVFGAIYAWKIQMVPVPNPVITFVVFKTLQPSDAARLLDKFQHVVSESVEDFSTTIIADALPDGLIWVQLPGLFLESKSAAVSLEGSLFSELGVPLEECKEMRWVETISYVLGLSNLDELRKRTQPNKLAFRMKSDFVRKVIPVEGFVGILERLKKEPHALILLHGLGGAMERIRSDAIPFPHRDGILFLIEYVLAWHMKMIRKMTCLLKHYVNYMTI